MSCFITAEISSSLQVPIVEVIPDSGMNNNRLSSFSAQPPPLFQKLLFFSGYYALSGGLESQVTLCRIYSWCLKRLKAIK